MPRLHQHLASYSQEHKNLEQMLTSEDLFLNESSIASIYIDLLTGETKHNCLLPQLEEILTKLSLNHGDVCLLRVNRGGHRERFEWMIDNWDIYHNVFSDYGIFFSHCRNIYRLPKE